MLLLSRDQQSIGNGWLEWWYHSERLCVILEACFGCTGGLDPDLDEGHSTAGLCNAGAQLIHAVLHGAQDFGLLRLWIRLCEIGV